MLAPHHKRVSNFIADTLICYLLTLSLGELGIVLNDNFAFDVFVIGKPEMDNYKFQVVNLLVSVVYYGLFESLLQRTPGKFITRTKVVNRLGEKPDEGTILLRTLCRQIPFEALSFLGPYGIGWHDMFSKTLVVDSRRAAMTPPADETPQSTDNE
ncbi:Uncharacterized membrane protein YckC, RDD family [Flavobacterium akiainvivens]|nr:Uncharacterized membrane protein YckC, RDD family [Flavobacterium akiainvivens]